MLGNNDWAAGDYVYDDKGGVDDNDYNDDADEYKNYDESDSDYDNDDGEDEDDNNANDEIIIQKSLQHQ